MDITYQELVDMVRVEVLDRISAISGLATYDQRRKYILDHIVYELMLCGSDLLRIAMGTRLMHENSRLKVRMAHYDNVYDFIEARACEELFLVAMQEYKQNK